MVWCTRFSLLAAVFTALAFMASSVRAEDNLYDTLGGEAGLTKIANDTIDNFLKDDRIKDTFANSNINRVRKMLALQFCAVAGGPCVYKGHSMAEAHKGLDLTNFDFNAGVEDVEDALDASHIPFAVQNRFLARLVSMQRDVVTR